MGRLGTSEEINKESAEISNSSTANETRTNDRIRAREVRLIGPDGSQLGIKSLSDALIIAREAELDLVEVAPLAQPPVCRIMNYSKFKFDEAQKAKESRRKSNNTSIKEMKYRLKIGPGDFDTKTRKVSKFLSEGHKVKVTIMFRGREMDRPQFGKQLLDRIAEGVAEVGKVEFDPKLDGRNMIMVLAPDRKAKPKVKAEDESEEASSLAPVTEVTQQTKAPDEAALVAHSELTEPSEVSAAETSE